MLIKRPRTVIPNISPFLSLQVYTQRDGEEQVCPYNFHVIVTVVLICNLAGLYLITSLLIRLRLNLCN